MDRERRFALKCGLSLAGLSMAGVGAITPRESVAAQRLLAVYYISPSYKALSFGPQGFVDQVKSLSSGKLEIDYYPGGQLIKADNQLGALSKGSIDMMFHTLSYLSKAVPILGIVSLPGIAQALYENPDRLSIGSPLFELINGELAKDNLIMLSSGGGVFEPEYIWSAALYPIRSLADLKDKNVRLVGYEAIKALTHFGATPVRVPSSESYLALRQRKVQGGVFNISTVVSRNLEEQLAFCLKVPVTAYSIAPFMRKDHFESLQPEAKNVILSASNWYDNSFVSQVNEEIYPNEFWPKVKAAGVEILEPNAEDIAKFDESNNESWAAWKNQVGQELGSEAIALALGQQ